MSHVKLILQEDVPSLGDAGEVVTVKPGYARNYLIPQGKALIATDAKVRELEHHRRVVAEKVARALKGLQAERKKLHGVELEFTAQAGEEGKLFGSVTSAQIAERLAERGFEVDRRKIVLAEAIKQLGEYEVAVRLHSDVEATIKVKVNAAV